MEGKFCEHCDSRGFIHKKNCTRSMNEEPMDEEEKPVEPEEAKFVLAVPYRLPDVPGMLDVIAFCMAENGVEISLSTYQKLPVELQPIFKKKEK